MPKMTFLQAIHSAQFEEMTRQNVAFFEKAFTMFTPFGSVFSGRDSEEDAPKTAEAKRCSKTTNFIFVNCF